MLRLLERHGEGVVGTRNARVRAVHVAEHDVRAPAAQALTHQVQVGEHQAVRQARVVVGDAQALRPHRHALGAAPGSPARRRGLPRAEPARVQGDQQLLVDGRLARGALLPGQKHVQPPVFRFDVTLEGSIESMLTMMTMMTRRVTDDYGRGGVAAIGQRNSQAIERAATGAYASRADATRAVGRSVFGGRARPKKPVVLGLGCVHGQPRNPTCAFGASRALRTYL